MLSYEDTDDEVVRKNIIKVSNQDLLPINHYIFLQKLRSEMHFMPKVAWDIGSAVFHWTRKAESVWPDCEFICFDANQDLEFLYKENKYDYFIGLLSDVDNLRYKYYYNRMLFGGNSYLREIGYNNGQVFPEDRFIALHTHTLDKVAKQQIFPYPDLIKIDVQGAELDILKGATTTLKYCKYLIVELQEIDYNKNAPKADVVIEYLNSIGYICIAPKFSNNGADADYAFVNTKI